MVIFIFLDFFFFLHFMFIDKLKGPCKRLFLFDFFLFLAFFSQTWFVGVFILGDFISDILDLLLDRSSRVRSSPRLLLSSSFMKIYLGSDNLLVSLNHLLNILTSVYLGNELWRPSAIPWVIKVLYKWLLIHSLFSRVVSLVSNIHSILLPLISWELLLWEIHAA